VRDQHWVVGVTEQQVQVLLEVDVEPEEDDVVDLRRPRLALGMPQPGAAGQPGWADLGRMLKERLPFRSRTTSTPVELDLDDGLEEDGDLDAEWLEGPERDLRGQSGTRGER
jgi:hypothetical protein